MARFSTILGFVVLLVAAPALSQGTLNSEILMVPNISTNTNTQFQVSLSSAAASTGLASRITVLNASSTDVNSLEYWSGSRWERMSLNTNSNGELTASSTNVTATMSYRISFRTAKNYVMGYVLEDFQGNVLSSDAFPITVTGSVLGTSKYMFNRNLSYGSKSNDVRALQETLRSKGLMTANPTGFFGPATLSAVKKYQAQNGLPTTGYLGVLTRAKLNQ